MKLFVDNDFCCHTSNPNGTFREVETNYFDGKCQTFIEGHRLVPKNEYWTRYDGKVFTDMISPFKPFDELDAAQREYERQMLADYESALAEIEAALGV